MGLFKKKPESAAIVVVSLGGREGLLPNFSYTLTEPETVVGREEACSIQIVDRQVSRQHVKIRDEGAGERYLITDLGSANGTMLNGRSLLDETILNEGDEIEIGDSRLVFTRKKFKDHESALAHFRRSGERAKGTMIK